MAEAWVAVGAWEDNTMAFTPYGNVDTEAGGTGQPFPATPSAGNVMSDTAPINNALGYGRSYAAPQADPMQYYFQLGQQMLQQQAQLQQQMAQQQGSGMDNSFDVGANPMLTAGFDPNWLTQRLAAGSANGASIQKMGGDGMMGGGGKKKPTPEGDTSDLPDGGVAAGWDTPTVPSYGGMKGAGRLF